MLRTSILYACETYYNLKENEIRQLERIEESFLRKMFKTTRGCPLSQLYLESGLAPARFEIKKIRLLFLQYILQESPESQLYRFLQLQIESPTKGDWATSCIQDLKELDLELSFDDIKALKKTQFTKILKKSIKQKAFEYVIKKQKKKGQDICYTELKMAEYLMPNSENISIEDRRNIFEIRNRMLPINENFPKNDGENRCCCQQIEDTKHIYTCKIWNQESEQNCFEEIYKENMPKLVKVYKRFRKNYIKREEYHNEKENSHAILRDPLFSVTDDGNGNKH